MNFLSWLFGKKEEATAAARPQTKQENATVAETRHPPVSPPKQPTAGSPPLHKTHSEAENLRRWRESGQARAWVEAHKGSWDHAAWLSLLDELKRSSFWPLPPEEIGKVLEAAKQEWLRRN